MKPFLALVLAPALSLTLGTHIVAQTIIRITDAPFTASIWHTSGGERDYAYVSQYLARARNGSTYVKTIDSDGRTMDIEIEDVPNNRSIHLIPRPPSYEYTLTPARGGKFRTETTDSYREGLRCLQNGAAKEAHDFTDMYGARHHPTVPSAKKQGDMTLFGRLDSLIYSNGKKESDEYWRSDLGLTFIQKEIVDSPTEGKSSSISTVIDLRLGDPDPKLFEIPAEYFAENDPLFVAKSVFIEDQTGEQEVTDGAIAMFKEWKHLIVAASRGKADIVAVFSQATRYDRGPAVTSIEMNVYQPDSDHPVFTTFPALGPDAATVATQAHRWIAGHCVLDLANRIDNTRIGLMHARPAQ
jgi:hypothetical protein